MWFRQSASAKLRTTNFSSEGLGGNSAKFFTSENSRYMVVSNFWQRLSPVHVINENRMFVQLGC